ncbi:MobA/MobL family protein [Bradyrhizobium vignae]|uniref:MobA/MobL protein domain-containing protein n=1 Tax=Bradyrhizobium vignae TaxID=1549949 RepID=A0A2U3PVV0_9BRAD|nr:MobA/MobL family protein [Bradyrhizobium vignae]RXG91290.1 hypothetical protein EAV90_28110 [Bradyrhizobium vignae]SPP93282.1 protein of unknown function [Bradyrhizobium vignae]
MAIIYLGVSFTHVERDAGAPGFLGYLGRSRVLDTRLARHFDFSNLDGDLVHSEIIRTDEVSERFCEIEHFANCVDEAEVYWGNFGADSRRQNGVAVVVALPPDSEITLAECAEFIKRIALLIAGKRRLAIHAAIHDPARMRPRDRNRHGHVFFPRREIHLDEISGPAIRDMFAHPLQLKTGGKTATIEGNRWPEFHQRQLLGYFAELGIDLVVDPIAPFPGRHWPVGTKFDDPRVQHTRARTTRLNIEAIHGDAVRLIDKLLRGRSAIRVAELQRLMDRFVDNENERSLHLETILSHCDLESFAVLPTATYPRVVTTAPVRSTIEQACRLVDRAADKSQISTIRAVTAQSHEAAIDCFKSIVDTAEHDNPPLVLGNNHSDCRQLAQAIKAAKPQVGTIKAALAELPNTQSLIVKNRLVIVPRAESIHDQTLARLIATADARSAPLVLVHDQSKQTGIASHRLAAYAVDRLAALNPAQSEDDVERYLRCGLIARSIELMAQHRKIEFDPAERFFDKSTSFDFLVCNDPRLLEGLNDQIRTLRIRSGELGTSIQLGHPLKPIQLSHDEWIVFTRDDYSSCPPVIRRGELAQVLNIDSQKNQITVSLFSGGNATIDLKLFAHFRPAHALLIREARNVDRRHRLLIDINDVHHVWAATLLAAQAQGSVLAVNPQVATNISSLILATAASLPGALPHQLTLRRDPNAELAGILRGEGPVGPLSSSQVIEPMPDPQAPEIGFVRKAESPAPAGTVEIEAFPEPKPPREIGHLPIATLHESVRAIVDSNVHTRRGMDRLRRRLRRGEPERDVNARHILGLCGDDSPLGAIVNMLMKSQTPAPADEMAELDLPTEIEQLSPQAWNEWDLYRLKIEFATLQWNFTSWEMTPVEFKPPVRDSWRRLFKNGEMSQDEIRTLSM